MNSQSSSPPRSFLTVSTMAFVLFRNPNRLRTWVDIRVGKTHIVEVLFQLRRQDYDWYIEHADEIHSEILEQFESTMLSRMFGKDIESYHRWKHPELFPPNDGVGDNDDDLIGSKNKFKKHRVGGARKKKAETSKKSSKSSSSDGVEIFGNDVDGDDGDDTDQDGTKVYYSFGSTIQLAYRKQPIGSVVAVNRFGTSASLSAVPHRTILVKRQEKTSDEEGHDVALNSRQEEEEPSSKKAKVKDSRRKQDRDDSAQFTFFDLEKLPDRLLVWISPSQSRDTSGISGDEEFFNRPEMIPVSSLFRTPKELEDDSDEDDDDVEGEIENEDKGETKVRSKSRG